MQQHSFGLSPSITGNLIIIKLLLHYKIDHKILHPQYPLTVIFLKYRISGIAKKIKLPLKISFSKTFDLQIKKLNYS
ncbi:hypothetical protein D0817_08110 [Flavobacterium cupreum]|uniref:Uncharacterized protein n=1 Tax=Flavobacterium cupreum TaxID=2133766 RepID=A0A434A9G8_9FLAO|nr:hypothetical protein D0817_08110 [Flavobacterium cupreum]